MTDEELAKCREGHKASCPGTPALSIRMHEGVYRIVRGCECGAVREIAPTGFETYMAAEAMLGFGWWR